MMLSSSEAVCRSMACAFSASRNCDEHSTAQNHAYQAALLDHRAIVDYKCDSMTLLSTEKEVRVMRDDLSEDRLCLVPKRVVTVSHTRSRTTPG